MIRTPNIFGVLF